MNKNVVKIITGIIFVALILAIAFISYFNSFSYSLNKAEQILITAGKTEEEISQAIGFMESKKAQLTSAGFSPEKLADMLVGNNTDTEVEVKDPETKVDVPEESNPVATIDLVDMGSMTFELFPMQAPQSVYNFISLANSDFYNGTIFHRVECSEDGTPLVAQGGDPEGTGTGGPGYAIKGEFSSNGINNELTHKKGSIAWARSSEADSAGSQFFINLVDNDNWNPDYAVFGEMLQGQDVLDDVASQCSVNSTDGSTSPKKEIKIESVTVDTKGIAYPEPDKI